MVKKLLTKAKTARHLALQRIRAPEKRRRVAKMIAKLLPKAESDERGREAAEKIRQEGFFILDAPFPAEKLRRIRVALEQRPCIDGWHRERGQFSVAQAPVDSNNVHVVDVETIPEAVEIANDPYVLSAVSAYLGCKPTIDDILAWWSLPGRPAPYEEQFFHRDQDSIRFLKLFVYLSDVGEAEGPHVFVRGSHRRGVLLSRGQRFTDELVYSQVPQEDVIRFTGPLGTAFLEDTYGLHKGSLPTTGTRLLLQVRYTILPSPFVGQGRKADVRGYDPYVNRFMGQG